MNRYLLIVVVNNRRIVAYEGTQAKCMDEARQFTRFTIEPKKEKRKHD